MSDKALQGVLTYIPAHIFKATEDWTVVAVGRGEESSVSVRHPDRAWGTNYQPADNEETKFDVAAGQEMYATKVMLEIKKKEK